MKRRSDSSVPGLGALFAIRASRVASNFFGVGFIDSPVVLLKSPLVQHQFRRPPLLVGHKTQLCGHDRGEEFIAAFRVKLDALLTGESREKMVAVPRNRENKACFQLVIADISIEPSGIERHNCSRPLLFGEPLRNLVRRRRRAGVLRLPSA
jgi:hypothetical protein